jgi:hypothetical protein
MILTDAHIEEIKAAANSVEFGSVTIRAGTENYIDIIIEKRIRLPKDNTKTTRRPPLLDNNTAKAHKTQ